MMVSTGHIVNTRDLLSTIFTPRVSLAVGYKLVILILLNFMRLAISSPNRKDIELYSTGTVYYHAYSYVVSVFTSTAIFFYSMLSLIVFTLEQISSGPDHNEFYPDISELIVFTVCFMCFFMYLVCDAELEKFYTRSIGIYPQHHLIQRGIYSKLIHPGYFAEFLFRTFFSIALGLNYRAVLTLCLYNFVYLQYICSLEETIMRTSLYQSDSYNSATDYDRYISSRYRFIPGVKFKLGPFIF